MKRLILLVAGVTLIATGSASGQGANQRDAIEQEVRKLDLAHADAVLRGDLAGLDKLWTEDFIVNNPFNGIDRADRIRTGAVTYASFIREPESVVVHGDTVIVMGRETVVPKGASPDAGKTINRRYTNIWMKRKGKWRLVARHASVICQQ
ncbi:MAG TPA: nuclear transport factor 2 family protein [Pyrinomonadaceae bacterium]|jgi:ketosteroid isomerase-like protein|nr:nuclear transport factor 2 family protein [Pyrinomonadaceae bacterium]